MYEAFKSKKFISSTVESENDKYTKISGREKIVCYNESIVKGTRNSFFH